MGETRKTYRLIDLETGAVIAARVVRASGIWERTKGLLGRPALTPEEGLWIDPCNGAHTFGMRYPIDLLILDRDGRVLRTVRALPPTRFSLPVRGGRSVVELAAGTIERVGLEPGGRVAFDPPV